MYDKEVKQCTKESFLPTNFVHLLDSLYVKQELVNGEGRACSLLTSKNNMLLLCMTLCVMNMSQILESK